MRKAVISILSLLAGAAFGACAAGRASVGRAKKIRSMSDKHLALFLMMNQWVKVKQGGKNLADYFARNGYGKIAVYGMGYVGETLVDELKGTGITVAYGIDRNADSLKADVGIVSMEDGLDPVDAVVVTAVTFFDEVYEELSGRLGCPVLSLEDVLFEV